MKKTMEFIFKVTVAHFVTYLVCGMLFSTLFNYETLFELGNAKYFMKDFHGSSSLIGPFVQIIRGLLLGFILLILKDNVLSGKRAWLHLWIIFAGLGIICTPGPAPFSIEGVVYSQLPLEFHLKAAPEILVQTLLFSLWVTGDFKWKISETVKISAVVTAISGVGFSLGGVLLALVLKTDIMESASDPFAFVVMFIAMIIVFFTTILYLRSKMSKRFIVVYYFVCYLALAGLPTVYNYAADSVMKSPLSLIFSGLPVMVIGIYLSYVKRKQNNKR